MQYPERRELGGLALIALITALVCWALVDPISRDDSHFGRAVLAGCGIATAVLWWVAHKVWAKVAAVQGVRALLVVLCVVGWFNYFQFDRKILGGINDYTDTAYYYTNSKYLAELGYDGLYAGALLCDAERGSRRTAHVQQYRDLRDDMLRPRQDALAHGKLVKEKFSAERWAGFCHDITYFLDRLDKRAISTNFFVDHGYNPPPTWTVVGGNLAFLVEVEHLKWICHADTVLLVLMFVGMAWWMGLEPMLWAMLFYTVTFSGRWPILGMAIMRFDWVAMVALGLAALSAGRYGFSGGSFAYAAANRVFPAIFFWGWLVEAILDVWQSREKGLAAVAEKHRRFAISAAVVGTLLAGVAAVQYGPRMLLESAHHLSLHNESFSSHRIGLGTVITYRGETTREEINQFTFADARGMRAKELYVQSWKTGLHGAALLVLGLIFAYAWRLRSHGERVAAFDLVPLVAVALYCATTPQANYLNYRIVCYLWHGACFARSDERRGRDALFHLLGLAVLLGTEVAAHTAHVRDFDRYSVNAVSSVGMLAYSVLVTSYLLWKMRLFSAPAPAGDAVRLPQGEQPAGQTT